jgi:hypothetical protein
VLCSGFTLDVFLLFSRQMGDVDIDVSEGLLGGAFSFQISLMGARGARSGGAAGERRSVRSLGDRSDREVKGADAFGGRRSSGGDNARTL